MTLTMLSKNSPNMMMMMMMNESSSPNTISSTTNNCNNNSCTLTSASNTLNNNLTREQLERFVGERQHIQENLRERNILRDYETSRLGYQVSHTLSSTIEKILWKKRQSSLSQKLENRPNIEQLEQRGIIPFLHHYYDQSSDSLNNVDTIEKPSSSNSSKENSPVSSPRLDHDHSSSSSPSSIPYLYDHEQTLSGIGLGREEKERKKRQIESFLVRRPSKKDLVELFTRRGGNASPTGMLGNLEQESTALIYDVTASSSNLSTFDPMSILLEPHVLQIHNQLENIYQQRVNVSSGSSSSDNLNEQDEETASNNNETSEINKSDEPPQLN